MLVPLRTSACALVLGVLGVGCGRNDAPPPAPAAAVSKPAPDRLAPDELAEGRDEAFGLKFPRGLKVRFRGPTRVEAEGTLKAEVVANYVRKRTKSQSIELGAARTVFEEAHIPGAKPDRPLRIEVVTTEERRTRLVVHDLSAPKVDPTLSPEDRWKKFGFDKDGRLIDPTKMD